MIHLDLKRNPTHYKKYYKDLTPEQQKIVMILSNINELKKKVYQLKKQRKKILLVHGVFDFIHLGHIDHFNEAKRYGDILFATVTSDRFVKKGFNKPYFKSRSNLRR